MKIQVVKLLSHVFTIYSRPQYFRRTTPCAVAREFQVIEKPLKQLQVSPRGRGPGRRSHHSAVALDATVFVIGGRSTTREYKDMYALKTDSDPPIWTEVRILELEILEKK